MPETRVSRGHTARPRADVQAARPPFDHANRRRVAPADEHRFRAGTDAMPETRVSRGHTARPRADVQAARPRSTTQIDAALRLPASTDSGPEPTRCPKHGSHGATRSEEHTS